MGVLELILGIFICIMVFLTIITIFYMKYDNSKLELENAKLQKDLQDARHKRKLDKKDKKISELEEDKK